MLWNQNYEHNIQQTLEDEATNSFEKLAPKFCGFQSAQPLGCHDNIALLGVDMNRWGHTKQLRKSKLSCHRNWL